MVTAKETHKAADLSLGVLGCGGRMGSALLKAASSEAGITFRCGSYKRTPPAFQLDNKEAQLTQCAGPFCGFRGPRFTSIKNLGLIGPN